MDLTGSNMNSISGSYSHSVPSYILHIFTYIITNTFQMYFKNSKIKFQATVETLDIQGHLLRFGMTGPQKHQTSPQEVWFLDV